MKGYKGKNGLTLISLVMIIVLMVVLSIIAVKMTQNSDLIDKTRNAKSRYSQHQEEEMVKQAINDAIADGTGEIKEKYLTSELNYQFGENEWKYKKRTSRKFYVQIVSSENIYKIYNNDSIEKVDEIPNINSESRFFYSGDGESQSGFEIQKNGKVYWGISDGKNIILPLIEGYVKKNAQIKVKDKNESGNTIEKTLIYEEAVFLSLYNTKFYYFAGEIKNGQLILYDTEYSDDVSNIDSETNEIILYDSISERNRIDQNQSQYFGDLVKGDIYYIESNEETSGFIAIDEQIITRGYITSHPGGEPDENITLMPANLGNIFIKEDFKATMKDGSIKDFSGKKIIFSTIEFNSSGSSFEGYRPIGYIQEEKLILFNTEVADSEEKDGKVISKTYNKIEESGQVAVLR